MITIPQAETAQRETLTALLISFFACTGCRVGEVRAMR
jgi:integrase